MNVWKYSLVAPFLVAFMFFFQVKVEAQTKIEEKLEKNATERVEFIIDKNTTEKEIDKKTSILKEKHQVALKVSKVKRNSDNEITALKIEYKGKNGTSGSTKISSDKPIEPVVFYLETKNGNTSMGLVQNPKSSHNAFVVHSKKGDEKQVIVWNSDDENEFDLDIDEDEINKIVNQSIDSLLTNHKVIISSINKIDSKPPKIIKIKKEGKVIIESDDDGDEEIYFISDDDEAIANHSEKIIEVQAKALERAVRKMEKAKTEMDFEWKKKVKNSERAEMSKMRAELEKVKEEIEKAKEEIIKAKEELLEKRQNKMEQLREEKRKKIEEKRN